MGGLFSYSGTKWLGSTRRAFKALRGLKKTRGHRTAQAAEARKACRPALHPQLRKQRRLADPDFQASRRARPASAISRCLRSNVSLKPRSASGSYRAAIEITELEHQPTSIRAGESGKTAGRVGQRSRRVRVAESGCLTIDACRGTSGAGACLRGVEPIRHQSHCSHVRANLAPARLAPALRTESGI